MLKILHTGDFHLDSPFTGVDLPTGERLRDELRKIFIDVVELARKVTLTLHSAFLTLHSITKPKD
jgi:DNA repair exonuclease SbcCD nuclease subunit